MGFNGASDYGTYIPLYMERGRCFIIQWKIAQRFVTMATAFFFAIAVIICTATFSTGITQNKPSPFAIRVLTNPGRISVTTIGSLLLKAFLHNASV